jgi:hypothetical protein
MARLQAAGFSAGVGGTMGSSVPRGLVAGTSPYGKAASGSFVTIYTSRGGGDRQPIPQPQVVQPPPGGGGNGGGGNGRGNGRGGGGGRRG